MAIDPRMAQNAAQSNIYTTNAGTGINIVNSQPYYSISVDNTRPTDGGHKIFAPIYDFSGPYHTSEVTEEFITRVNVYTNAMLSGDIKQISSEYLWAVKAALNVLKRANHKLSPELTEMLWKQAADGKGSLPEDFAKAVQQHVLGR